MKPSVLQDLHCQALLQVESLLTCKVLLCLTCFINHCGVGLHLLGVVVIERNVNSFEVGISIFVLKKVKHLVLHEFQSSQTLSCS